MTHEPLLITSAGPDNAALVRNDIMSVNPATSLMPAANVERLDRCDQAARGQINRRIARLIEHKGS